MKLKRNIALLLSIALMLGILAGCGGKGNGTGNTESSKNTNDTEKMEAATEDVVTALLPPVSATYQDKLEEWAKQFNDENPGITLKITPASWEDVTDKLDVQVNAGSPPDIAFIGSDGVSKYLDTELLVDISQYAEEAQLDDFDSTILNYFKNGDGQYGLPAYAEVQCIGGNRQMLEDAGIDWKKIQKEGWSYEEFREAIKKGVIKTGDTIDTYGFVFACAGVAAKDYFSIFVNNVGMASAFDKELKYTYSSPAMLDFLTDIRALIDDGSMPKELSSVDAGKRWNMFLTGQTMITGKGLSSFEKSAAANNEKIETNDGSAVEGSIEVDYIVLPVPTFSGNEQQAYGAVDGYVCFRGKEKPTDEHMQNVMKALYFLASAERAAETCSELYLKPICKSGLAAYEKLEKPENKNENNTLAVETLIRQIAEPRPDIPADLGAKAIKIEDEVIVPKFQGLLSGEITPEEMYEAIKKAGIEYFGEDGCILE